MTHLRIPQGAVLTLQPSRAPPHCSTAGVMDPCSPPCPADRHICTVSLLKHHIPTAWHHHHPFFLLMVPEVWGDTPCPHLHPPALVSAFPPLVSLVPNPFSSAAGPRLCQTSGTCPGSAGRDWSWGGMQWAHSVTLMSLINGNVQQPPNGASFVGQAQQAAPEGSPW